MAYVYYYYTYHTPVSYQYSYPCNAPAVNYSHYQTTTYSALPSSSSRHKHKKSSRHSHESEHKYCRCRIREPTEGHCFLLFFKEKYWKDLKRIFGPNSNEIINTPDAVIRQFMHANPHMVSSRKDLQRYRTGPYLTHIAPGGNSSPWELA